MHSLLQSYRNDTGLCQVRRMLCLHSYLNTSVEAFHHDQKPDCKTWVLCECAGLMGWVLQDHASGSGLSLPQGKKVFCFVFFSVSHRRDWWVSRVPARNSDFIISWSYDYNLSNIIICQWNQSPLDSSSSMWLP